MTRLLWKSEYHLIHKNRPKSETISKSECSKFKTKSAQQQVWLSVLVICIWVIMVCPSTLLRVVSWSNHFEFRVSYFVLPRPLAVGKSYDFPHHIILPFQDASLMGRGTSYIRRGDRMVKPVFSCIVPMIPLGATSIIVMAIRPSMSRLVWA